MMKTRVRTGLGLIAGSLLSILPREAPACSRLLYETGTGTYVVARSMDWNDTTISAADRFVRLSYNLEASPKFKDRDLAVASAFPQIRAISVPLGMSDPERRNIASTLWRTVADQDAKRYYFESVVFPAVFWVDVAKVDLSPGARPTTVAIERDRPLAGEASAHFSKATPFAWLR
jgi:penicillin V acylase-like amidase (Ntn superfamily)